MNGPREQIHVFLHLWPGLPHKQGLGAYAFVVAFGDILRIIAHSMDDKPSAEGRDHPLQEELRTGMN
jgi:hypothetical protein